MSEKEGFEHFFSPSLLKHVKENLVTKELNRFRLRSVTWLDAAVLEKIPGNLLREDKLEKVKKWLCSPEGKTTPLDIFDEHGLWIGLPMVTVDCSNGSIKLAEGNHRVHVLIKEMGVTKVPVEVIFIETETPPTKGGDFDKFHNKLLDLLFRKGFNHSGFWSNKEVWRACAYLVIKSFLQ